MAGGDGGALLFGGDDGDDGGGSSRARPPRERGAPRPRPCLATAAHQPHRCAAMRGGSGTPSGAGRVIAQPLGARDAAPQESRTRATEDKPRLRVASRRAQARQASGKLAR